MSDTQKTLLAIARRVRLLRGQCELFRHEGVEPSYLAGVCHGLEAAAYTLAAMHYGKGLKL